MIERLTELLQGMDVPPRRIETQDWAWMGRNLGVRNSGHPDFAEARELIRKIRSHQRAHAWPR